MLTSKVKSFNRLSLDFGERLKLVRTQKNITQAALARKLNVSAAVVCKWESNAGLYYGISLNNAIRIARVFEMKLSDLVGE